jgi:hypothetical protein
LLEWLRHYATSRKVAGSRPYEANEFSSIYLIFPAALGPVVYSALTEMSTRNRKIMFIIVISRKVMFLFLERPVRMVDNLAAICEPIV